MRSDLTLTGVLPGLLRRGSPVWWRDEETPYVVARDYFDAHGATWTIAAPCVGIPLGVQDDPSNFTLDLTDPTGRYHALLWLRERGHELRWAEDEADVLAWSVLSVARGGGPIAGIYICGEGPHVVNDAWVLNGYPYATKEEADAKRARVKSARLAAHYILRNEDGSLTFPELPKENA